MKKKRKLFVAPLIPVVATGALTALDIGVGMKSSEEAQDLAEKQARQNKKISSQLDKIIEGGNKSDELQAASILKQNKYSAGGSVLKTLGGFGKDLGKLAVNHKKGLIVGTASGLTLGTSSYLTDKAIQKDMERDEKQKTYSAGSILKGIGKEVVKNKKSLIFPAVLGAAPALGYAVNKKIQSDMVEDTANSKQKSYSISGKSLRALAKMRSGFRTFKSHPGQSILGGISNITGGGGTAGVKAMGAEISSIGKESGNKITQALGKGITNNPKTSLAASVPVGLGVLSATWGGGERVVNKTARALDKNAFKYQDSQNKEIE